MGCTGSGADGYIRVTDTNRIAGRTISYRWSHLGYAAGGPDSVGGLSVGTYRVIATDDQFCQSDTLTVQISSAALNLSLGFSLRYPFKCTTDTANTLIVIGSGGTPPYQYNVDNKGWQTADSSRIQIWVSREYIGTVKVRDQNGCQFDSTYLIRPQSYLSVTAMHDNPTICGNTPTARMRFSNLYPSLVAMPVEYKFHTSGWQTDTFFYNQQLVAGWYRFYARDAIGCTLMDSTYVFAHPELKGSNSVQPILCLDSSNGQITLTALGGTLPYQYRLGTGSYQPGNIFAGLDSGSYQTEIKDDVGCTFKQTIRIDRPVYTLQVAVQDSIRCAGDLGNIRALLTGTTAGMVSYALNAGSYSSTNLWSGLGAGSYMVSIRYASVCQLDRTVSLPSPTPLLVSHTARSLVCAGDRSGQISLSIAGGSAPYTIAINGQTQSVFNPLISNLSGGSYTILVKDRKGCDTSFVVFLSEPAALQIQTRYQRVPRCAGQTNGAISVRVLGGVQPYVYRWSTGANIDSISNLAAGSYTLTVLDSLGCQQIANYTVNDPKSITVRLTTTDPRCHGDTNGRIQANISGGQPPYRLIWNDGATAADRSNLIANLDYTLVVTDSVGCTQSVTARLAEPPRLSISAMIKDATCVYTRDGYIVAIAGGGSTSSPYQFRIDNLAWQTKTDFQALGLGSYRLQVRDAQNCIQDTLVQIRSYPAIGVSLDSPIILNAAGQEIILSPRIQQPAPDMRYRWSSDRGLSCIDCAEPTFSGYAPGVYTLIVSYNQDKCSERAGTYIILPPIPDSAFFIPTAFAPDALTNYKENTIFRVYGRHIRNLDLAVYNRWGEKVYGTNDKTAGWDGSYRGTPAPTGIYTYRAELRLLDNTIRILTGSVTLIR